MDFDFSAAVRLSLKYGELPSFRGHPPALTSVYTHSQGSSRHAVVSVPVHSMTHRDFPLDAKTEMRVIELNPVVQKAAVIDCRSKKKEIENFFLPVFQSGCAPKSESTDRLPFLDQRLIGDEEGLLKLVERLAISRVDIETGLRELGIYDHAQDYCLLFRTDWITEFHKHRVSYNNPFFEGMSALLCHPHLSHDAIACLKDRGISSVGHDLPSFENPLLYAQGPYVTGLVREARQLLATTLKSEQRTLDEKTFEKGFNIIGEQIGRRPVYLKLLNFRSLRRKDTQRKGQKTETNEPSNHAVGRVAMIPVPAIHDPEGVACEVYFSYKDEK
jgi:hypothetical protein